nr:hypothetical protein [Candidatus Palauibacterales bacterium]
PDDLLPELPRAREAPPLRILPPDLADEPPETRTVVPLDTLAPDLVFWASAGVANDSAIRTPRPATKLGEVILIILTSSTYCCANSGVGA